MLFLQGPMGFFFRKLRKCLRDAGAETWQVCFNGGDAFFSSRDHRIFYRGSPEAWRFELRNLLENLSIDTLVLFGDCRFYNQVSIEEAKAMGVEAVVFEEGYVRPHYLTVEKGGVNDFSPLSREADFYRKMPPLLADPASVAVNHAFGKMAFQAIIYFSAMGLGTWRFPKYQHHRDTSICKEMGYGLCNMVRKNIYRILEKGVDERLQGEWRQGYFFVPLQTESDAQLRVHSSFFCTEAFIVEVITSFARNAPEASRLIFKHHPMDRGVSNYSGMIRKLSEALGVGERVHYYHDIHLPTALKYSLGTVTINSTVGISSLVHNIPTLVLGQAIYDIEGLTCKGMALDRFWIEAEKPDTKLFRAFRRYLLCTTQVSGSFYTGFPDVMPLLQKIMGKAGEDFMGSDLVNLSS